MLMVFWRREIQTFIENENVMLYFQIK